MTFFLLLHKDSDSDFIAIFKIKLLVKYFKVRSFALNLLTTYLFKINLAFREKLTHIL